MTPSTSRLLIATATYNERESLPNLLATVRQVLADVDILVIDDNSPDGTGTWVDGQAARDPRLHVQHRPAKLGLGTATIAALEYALVHRYDVIVTLDADGSHDPKYIPALLQKLGTSEQPGADVVVGSRYVPGGGIIGWPWYRLVMSRMVNAAARILLGLAVHDCSGAFRAMRVAMIRRVELHQVRSRGYSFFEEILWHFKQAGARFDELPIVFTNRIQGKSKINLGESLWALAVLLRLGAKNWLRI